MTISRTIGIVPWGVVEGRQVMHSLKFSPSESHIFKTASQELRPIDGKSQVVFCRTSDDLVGAPGVLFRSSFWYWTGQDRAGLEAGNAGASQLPYDACLG